MFLFSASRDNMQEGRNALEAMEEEGGSRLQRLLYHHATEGGENSLCPPHPVAQGELKRKEESGDTFPVLAREKGGKIGCVLPLPRREKRGEGRIL